MKTPTLAVLRVRPSVRRKRVRLIHWACVGGLILVGCTTTQLRWDATKMREQVMYYYNDEIMDNLIRAHEKLPFVHVDISTLTTIDASQITGTVGDGEMRSKTRTFMGGVLQSVGRTVTWPFTY